MRNTKQPTNETSSAPDPYWSRPQETVLAKLRSTPAGLSTGEAKQRLQQYGPNALEVHRQTKALWLLLDQFKNPLVLILIFAAGVSGFVQEWTDAIVILAIVIASALVTFFQEYSATNAMAKLQERLTIKASVLRDGQPQSIPVEQVVPGDVVLLSAGSVIAADGVVLETKDLHVNQAVLTGETFPAEKQVEPVKEQASLAERSNCVFTGTSVQSGTAKVLIVNTGMATEFGQIAHTLALRPPETEFERGIRRFGYMITRVMIALVLVVFAVNVFSAKPPVDSLLFAIALAVGMAPELLPAIMSLTLSKGAQEMAKRGVLVKRLNAIENFGSMDVLCTDKTGTLTQGVVTLKSALDVAGQPSDDVLRYAFLNAHFQTGLDNPLDEAIIAQGKGDPSGVTKLDEVPYDFIRKRLSVVVQMKDQPPEFISKGALDNVLAVCDRMRQGTATIPLGDAEKEGINRLFVGWSEQGFRVLGVAAKPVAAQKTYTRTDESNLIFTGFLLFFDPPKPDAQAAIAALRKLGVRLKIITGDNRRVAEHVANMVGMPLEGILTGSELNAMHDDALLDRAQHVDLFAEVDPNQKGRIISALRKSGHVVGYMGDGINDAPALHDADVGISVETAVDVAREAADFVLLKSDLDVLRRGIEEGRVTFANTLKYVFMTTSANFGNMFSMAGASLFLPFLPMLAEQILLTNFLTDLPAMTIATDNVDPELAEKPRRWDVTFIRDFMIVFGLVSSVFDYVTFGLLWLVAQATPEQFRTGWFIESTLTELLVVFILRTRRPFFQSRPGTLLIVSSIAVAVVAVAIPYLPFAGVLGFVPLSPVLLAALLAITLVYVLMNEVAKRFFYTRLHRES